MRSALLLAALTAMACSQEPARAPTAAPAPTGPLRVVAVNAPLASLARAVGGPAVEVVFPAPPDVDPAHWTPDPETVAAIGQADLVLRNGAGYARWLDRASLRAGRLVDTSAAFRDALIPIEENAVHRHGPEGATDHGPVAFTVWLDPNLAMLQARAIAAAFSAARPEKSEGFAGRLAEVTARLGALDQRLAAASRALGDTPLLLSHPVYQYPTARYAWNARALHWEPDVLPEEADWQALDALLVAHPARHMLWEAPPMPEIRRRLGTRGITPRVFAPAANLPAAQDWLPVMEANVTTFESLPSP
jgi:zinc transport system substrate-binding protein